MGFDPADAISGGLVMRGPYEFDVLSVGAFVESLRRSRFTRPVSLSSLVSAEPSDCLVLRRRCLPVSDLHTIVEVLEKGVPNPSRVQPQNGDSGSPAVLDCALPSFPRKSATAYKSMIKRGIHTLL